MVAHYSIGFSKCNAIDCILLTFHVRQLKTYRKKKNCEACKFDHFEISVKKSDRNVKHGS